MKNADSVQIIRNPNIELIRKRLTKGIDIIPLNAELFGRNWIGPDKKNLLIPKEAANRLMIKVIRGKAAFRSSNHCIVTPSASFG